MTDSVITDAWNLDTALTGWLGTRLSALADEAHSWPGNSDYPTPEDWEHDLRLASAMLGAYSAYQSDYEAVGIGPDAGPNWIQLALAHENMLATEASVALHWVADQLTHLWD